MCTDVWLPRTEKYKSTNVLIINVKDMLSLLLLSSCSSFSVYLYFPFVIALFDLFYFYFILFHYIYFILFYFQPPSFFVGFA